MSKNMIKIVKNRNNKKNKKNWMTNDSTSLEK